MLTQFRMYRLFFLFVELEYNQSVSFLCLTLVKNFLVSQHPTCVCLVVGSGRVQG